MRGNARLWRRCLPGASYTSGVEARSWLGIVPHDIHILIFFHVLMHLLVMHVQLLVCLFKLLLSVLELVFQNLDGVVPFFYLLLKLTDSGIHLFSLEVLLYQLSR
jgi:hypothetical protein